MPHDKELCGKGAALMRSTQWGSMSSASQTKEKGGRHTSVTCSLKLEHVLLTEMGGPHLWSDTESETERKGGGG